VSTLNDWNQIFDEKMRPIVQPDHRGKSCKVTLELVKRVVEEAKKWKSKGKRIRVKSFTRKLAAMDMSLSSKTVGDILIANDLREPQTRKRRPRFYQSLCQRIPNGLLSLDGGEFVVWFGDHPIPLNLELSVDTGTFTHTAFSIGNTETRHEVLNVLKSHIKTWGQPIGVLFDHGSANLSHDVQGYLKKHGIEIVPAGPANPKGNGSLEGAFSQMKQVIGTIYIDPSSPETLAKSILQSIAWVYIKMRNKLSLRGKNSPPIVNMNIPLTQEDIENERKRLQDHKNAKLNKTDDQPKIDRIRILIKNMGLNVEPTVVQRAEKTIIAYEMKAIMAEVGFEGSLAEFFVFMREDQQFYYPTTDEGREAYLAEANRVIDAMRAKLPEMFGLLPKSELIVKRVEAFREKSAGKAFYQGPPADGSRPGIFYANLYDMADMPKYQLEALAYHEGVPGHHMQRAISVELKDVPEFQKYASFTAYTEGWGLYTEQLGREMGFYEDPYSNFGRLAMELWRACRLVVDTGIHSKRWTREEAIDYLVENTPNSVGDSSKAIERYIAMPGQATAYMIGKLKIIELREKAKAAMGDKFDIRQFHDEVLKDGPVPLSLLEQKVDGIIKGN